MKQYTDILRQILGPQGRVKKNRTGTDARTIIGPSMTFMMDDGFPMETARPIFFKGIVHENLWFIDGNCNNEVLLASDIKIWDAWALKEDVTEEVGVELPEIVEAYVAHRRKLQAEAGEEVNYDYGKAVQELQTADFEDHQKGLPIVGDTQGKPQEELQGGHRLLREAGIPLTKLRTLFPKGYLGPIYGVLWRRWLDHNRQRVDQLANIYGKLASDNPKLRYSRSNIITSFNPAVLPDETKSAQENIKNGRQALAACHTMFQLLAEPMTLEERIEWSNRKCDEAAAEEVEHGAMVDRIHLTTSNLWTFSQSGKTAEEFTEEDAHATLDAMKVARDQLSLVMYQRSADFPVGVPFNIAGYALLLHMFAAQLNMKPYQFTHHFGDAHIYVDQIDGVKELLERVDTQTLPPLPKLWINPNVQSISDYKPEDFKLVGYNPIKPQIKFPVAV